MCPIQLAQNLTKSDCTKKVQKLSPKTYPLTTKNNRQKPRYKLLPPNKVTKGGVQIAIAPTKKNCQRQLFQDLKFATPANPKQITRQENNQKNTLVITT